ncbi:hypothetical protein ADS79_05375 [Brevibacillus reuszeri]|uniref:Uncharacterized protein n=1 Tax=Brevibacillus reuszeri TaxID=54915 RepID=A0A0K9YXH9_9BACL|nr:hypothetical protein ADS79_05375 [Brevibacillus reuszeri]
MTLFKRFSFWLVFLSFLICCFDYFGNDAKHILLFVTNPLFDYISYVEPFRSWIIKVSPDADSVILPTGYLLHMVIFFLFGLLIDTILLLRKRTINT